MRDFQYRAIGPNGHLTEGHVTAVSMLDAAHALEHQGMRVIDLHPAPIGAPTKATAAVGSGPILISRGPTPSKPAAPSPVSSSAPPTTPAPPMRPIRWRPWTWDLLGIPLQSQQQFFFLQLHNLVAANVPLVQALTTLENNTSSKKLQQIASRMAQNAAAGRPISEAFDAFPNCVSPVVVNTIRAGEIGGYLETALKEVVDYLGTSWFSPQFAIDRSLRNLLAWAIPLSIMYAVVVLFFDWQERRAGIRMGYVYEVHLIRRDTRLVIFLILALFFLGTSHSPRFSKMWNSLFSMGRNAAIAAEIRFARALAHLLESGMELSTAFEHAVRAATSPQMETVLLPQAQALRNGESLADVLQRSGVCSRVTVDFARTGQTSGTLPESLENAVVHLELDLASRWRNYYLRRWYF